MHYCINKFFMKFFTVILLLYLIFAAAKVKIKLPSHFWPYSIGWVGLKQLYQQFLTIYACQIFSDFQKHYFCLSSYSLMKNCLLFLEHFGVSTAMMVLLKGTYPVSSVRAQSKLFVEPWGCMNFHVTECSSFLLFFHDYWIMFYNFTLWRPNFTHMSTLAIQTRKAKKIINFKFFWQIWTHK